MPLVICENIEFRNIASKSSDEALALACARDSIGDTREHDWDGAGSLQQWREGGAGQGQDDVRLKCGQLGCIFSHRVGFAVTPTILDADILSVRPAQLLQGLHESRHAALRLRIVCGPRS